MKKTSLSMTTRAKCRFRFITGAKRMKYLIWYVPKPYFVISALRDSAQIAIVGVQNRIQDAANSEHADCHYKFQQSIETWKRSSYWRVRSLKIAIVDVPAVSIASIRPVCSVRSISDCSLSKTWNITFFNLHCSLLQRTMRVLYHQRTLRTSYQLP